MAVINTSVIAFTLLFPFNPYRVYFGNSGLPLPSAAGIDVVCLQISYIFVVYLLVLDVHAINMCY